MAGLAAGRVQWPELPTRLRSLNGKGSKQEEGGVAGKVKENSAHLIITAGSSATVSLHPLCSPTNVD